MTNTQSTNRCFSNGGSMSSIPASLSHPLTTMATMATHTTHIDPVRSPSPRPAPRSTSADHGVRAPFDRHRNRVYRRRRPVAALFVGLVWAAIIALVFVVGRDDACGAQP